MSPCFLHTKANGCVFLHQQIFIQQTSIGLDKTLKPYWFTAILSCFTPHSLIANTADGSLRAHKFYPLNEWQFIALTITT